MTTKRVKLFNDITIKRFSIEGGGYGKLASRSLVSEGMKRVAQESKYRSTSDSEQSLVESVKRYGNGRCAIGRNPEDSQTTLSAYQLGDVLVISFHYLGTDQRRDLNEALDAYCRTFKNADYSSEFTYGGGAGFIELWIAPNSLDFLVSKLIEAHLSINVVL